MVKNKIQIFETLGLLAQVGLMMAAAIILGLFAGRFLDAKLGTSPIFTLVFILLGICGGFFQLFKLLTPKRDGKK
jgi:F0F1-type ATP synthase assembly protein I